MSALKTCLSTVAFLSAIALATAEAKVEESEVRPQWVPYVKILFTVRL